MVFVSHAFESKTCAIQPEFGVQIGTFLKGRSFLDRWSRRTKTLGTRMTACHKNNVICNAKQGKLLVHRRNCHARQFCPNLVFWNLMVNCLFIVKQQQQQQQN